MKLFDGSQQLTDVLFLLLCRTIISPHSNQKRVRNKYLTPDSVMLTGVTLTDNASQLPPSKADCAAVARGA